MKEDEKLCIMETKELCRKDELWDKLLREIWKGNVIPIIGNELLHIKVGEECMHLDEYLIQKLAKFLDIEYTKSLTFTELKEYGTEWKKKNSELYHKTTKILKEMPKQQVQISESLQKLLSIDNFKLILTTTIDDLMFNAMEKKRGKDIVKQLSYSKEEIVDINSDFSQPLLYHIFGRAGVIPEAHSFVLTEDDLLEFLCNWLSADHRPKKLFDLLQSKYLLVVGCNYPNWLFRFFLYSMKPLLNPSNNKKTGVVADSKLDKELIAFLSRINNEHNCDTEKFINELVEKWDKYSREHEKNDIDTENEIFICYAHEDFDTASDIVNKLEKKWDAKIWFDKKKGAIESGLDFDKKIERQIKKCKAFVPILSNTTIKRKEGYFRTEWGYAEQAYKPRTSTRYFFPIIIDEKVDLEHEHIHKLFTVPDIMYYNSKNFEDKLQEMIRYIRK